MLPIIFVFCLITIKCALVPALPDFQISLPGDHGICIFPLLAHPKTLSGIADLEEVLQEKDFYLDFLKILDDLEYIAADKPLIFTMRSVQQGGMLQLSQMQKAEIYQLVARSGLAGLIDVELPASAQTADDICEDGGISLREQIDEIHAFGGKVICSYHEFDRMLAPEEILGRIHIMQAAGADVFKIAAMAVTKEDAEVC